MADLRSAAATDRCCPDSNAHRFTQPAFGAEVAGAARPCRGPPVPERASRRQLQPYKLLTLNGGNKTVEYLVDPAPRFECLHVVEPALAVGVTRQVAADQLSNRNQRGTEIVRDR